MGKLKAAQKAKKLLKVCPLVFAALSFVFGVPALWVVWGASGDAMQVELLRVCTAGTCSDYDAIPATLAECRSGGHTAFALIVVSLALTVAGAVFVIRSTKKAGVKVQAGVWTLAMVMTMTGVIVWSLGCLEELELDIGAGMALAIVDMIFLFVATLLLSGKWCLANILMR